MSVHQTVQHLSIQLHFYIFFLASIVRSPTKCWLVRFGMASSVILFRLCQQKSLWSFCFKWWHCGKLARLSGQPWSIHFTWATTKWEWFLFIIQNGFSLVTWWKDTLYAIASLLNCSTAQCVFHLHYTSPVFLGSAFFAWFRGPLESCMWVFALNSSRSQRLWTADTSLQTGRRDGGTVYDRGTEVVVVLARMCDNFSTD